MTTLTKTILLVGIILPCIIGGWGCKGGKVPELGDISGPATVDEYGYVEYSISFVNATNPAFLWSCDPADAGKFDRPDSLKTGFTASMVTHDTPVKISVMVDNMESSPVILSKNITVRDVTKFSVSEINGPDTVEDGASVTYSVTATGDTGISYQWHAVPDDLGIFDAPNEAVTRFTASYVNEDTPAEIWVNVESDNYGPFVRKKDINIVDILSDGWARTWGGIYEDDGYGVAIDGSGNVYVTGRFRNTVDFDPGPGIDEHTSNGYKDVFLSKFDSNGVFQWARNWTWGSGSYYSGYGVAVDGSGNAYVTGGFSGTVDFNPGPGVDEHTSYGEEDIFLGKFDTDGQFQWIRTWGGEGHDYGYGIATDGNGNVHVTGVHSLTVDFDPGPGIDEHSTAKSYAEDAFLSRFDLNGEYQWTRTWGGDGSVRGRGCAVYGDGNSYVTGTYSRTVDFDPGPGIDEYTSYNGHNDIFLSNFDPDGEFQWVRTWGGGTSDGCNEVAVDGGGNAYVTGFFDDTVDFDPGTGTDWQTTDGERDIFLSKIDSDGEFQWARTWGGYYCDYSSGVAVDDNGCAYVTGDYSPIVDFDPGPGVEERTDGGLFLSKFNSNGGFLWVRTWGGYYFGNGHAVAVDASGNAFVTGCFPGTVDFDPGPGVDEHTSNGSWDIFLCKFPPDGNW